MPRYDDEFDSSDDSDSDFDDSDVGEDAAIDDDGEPTIPCPFCRAEIWEDAPRCPRCANELGGTDMPSPRRPWWVLITALILLALFGRSLFPW